jgi:hypothetical protein
MNSKKLKTKVKKGLDLSVDEREYLIRLMKKHTDHLNVIIDILINIERSEDDKSSSSIKISNLQV